MADVPTVDTVVESAESQINSEQGDINTLNTENEATPEQKQEQTIQNLKKKLKLKVDGEEIEEEIDLANEEELVRRLQKAKAFDKRAGEFTGFKKNVENFFNELKSNPFEVLQNLGFNVDEMSEQHLTKKVEELKKSPQQLEQEKMQKELETLRKEKEDATKRAEQAEMEKLRNQQAAEIETDIVTALKASTTSLPESPFVISRIAQSMLLAMKKGYHNVTAKDVIPVVEKQFKDELQQIFGKLPEEILEQLIGNPNIERLRKHRIKRKQESQTKTANQISKDVGKTSTNDKKPEKKISYKDFFKVHDD